MNRFRISIAVTCTMAWIPVLAVGAAGVSTSGSLPAAEVGTPIGAQGVLFSDDFDNGARPEWVIENGGWVADEGHLRVTTSCGFQQCNPNLYANISLPSSYIVSFDFLVTAAHTYHGSAVSTYLAMTNPVEPYEAATSGYSIGCGWSSDGSPANAEGGIQRIDDSGFTIIGHATGEQFWVEPNVLYHMRAGRIGSDLVFKKWTAGTPEPDWQVTATDTTYSGGFFMPTYWNQLGWIDNVVVTASAGASGLAFTDVFAQSGFTDWTCVNQVRVVDFDGDGWDDLFFARRDGMLPRLYINNGLGGFTENNEALGPIAGLLVELADFGDVDNDGGLDVLTRTAEGQVRLFRRISGGFVDVTPASLGAPTYSFVTLCDSDNDGDLDMAGIQSPVASRGRVVLQVNNAGDFNQVELVDGMTWLGLGDLNADGFVDFVASDGTSHHVFANNGGNQFSGLGTCGLASPVHYEASLFDFDNDGDLDIYGGNPDWAGPPRLSRNEGNFVFVDAGLPPLSVGNHYYAQAIAGDPDRDGDLDYYNTLGAWTDGLYFRNDGNQFVECAAAYGIRVGGGNTTKTGIWFDYDRDSDLDLLVVNTWNADGGWLFRNDIDTGNWLEVRPEASASNSSLRGVRVVAHWQGASQVLDYDYGAGVYTESGSHAKLFGIGAAAFADSVVVYWPSGAVSVSRNVPANTVLEVAESPRLSILAVSDVPNDQGGFINVKFSALAGGQPDGGGLLLGYEVQRWDSGTWATVAAMAPQGVDPYDVQIATPDVLTIGQSPTFTRVRVAAQRQGAAGLVCSRMDSTYSVDNIAPPKPSVHLWEDLTSRYIFWDTPAVDDLATVCIYRGDQAGFAPGVPLECPSVFYQESDLGWYFYRVQFSDIHGNVGEFSDELHGQWPSPVGRDVIARLHLRPCQPNPFNPQTVLTFELPQAGMAKLAVFDLAGRLVRTLVDEALATGIHDVEWDGRDSAGREVGSGTYLARLEAAGGIRVTRMALLR